MTHTDDITQTFPEQEAAIHKTLTDFHESITRQIDELVEGYENQLSASIADRQSVHNMTNKAPNLNQKEKQ